MLYKYTKNNNKNSFKYKLKDNRGFMALAAVLIITAVLLIIISTTSISGFFGRFDALASENKRISLGLSESCSNSALLKIANDYKYLLENDDDFIIGKGVPVLIGTDTCYIKEINYVDGEKDLISNVAKNKIATIITNAQYPEKNGSWSKNEVIATIQNPEYSSIVPLPSCTLNPDKLTVEANGYLEMEWTVSSSAKYPFEITGPGITSPQTMSSPMTIHIPDSSSQRGVVTYTGRVSNNAGSGECATTVFIFTPTVFASSIDLPVTIRDFHGYSWNNNKGHIDFENADPGIDKGIVGVIGSLLDDNKKPVYAGQLGNPSTHGQIAFDQWYRDTTYVNKPKSDVLTFDWDANKKVYFFKNSSFFPIDGELFGNESNPHNYHFTLELHNKFAYKPGQIFKFKGDDDLWVFIDNKLVIDLGGRHSALDGEINLDDIIPKLTEGNVYNFDLFFAERHTSQSNFLAETNIAFPFTLTYTAGTGGIISGISPQVVYLGNNGTTITAKPDDGYYFIGWSDGKTTISREDINVNNDISVTAIFAPDITNLSGDYNLPVSIGAWSEIINIKKP